MGATLNNLSVLGNPVLWVQKSSDQALSASLATITFGVVTIDNNGWWNTSTNTYNPKKAGYYLFYLTLGYNTNPAGVAFQYITRTGTSGTLNFIAGNANFTTQGTTPYWTTSFNLGNSAIRYGIAQQDIIYMNGTDDTIKIQGITSSTITVSGVIYSTSIYPSQFRAFYLGDDAWEF